MYPQKPRQTSGFFDLILLYNKDKLNQVVERGKVNESVIKEGFKDCFVATLFLDSVSTSQCGTGRRRRHSADIQYY